MSTLPDSVYDEAVRTYLRVPARHHISIGHLRATIDDPAAFRDALTVAWDARTEDLERAEAERDKARTAVHRYFGHAGDWPDCDYSICVAVRGGGPIPRFDLGNPLGWTPDQIRRAEEGSAEIERRWVLDDDEGRDEHRVADEFAETIAYHEGQMRALGITTPLAEARASVALDGETVTLDEPQVTP